MKSKLMVVVVLLLLPLLAVPVMAIGPGNAVKNPNLIVHDGETVLLTPGGVQNEYRDPEAGVFDFFHILNASKMELPGVKTFSLAEIGALMSNPEAALAFENKWGYISQKTLLGLLQAMGMPKAQAEAMAAMWPDGMYFRFHNIGK